MPPYLCVYGHVALDYILSLDHFPPLNTSVDVLDKRRYYGGTAANLAVRAAALGVPTALVSYVGEDFPRDYQEFLERHGVMLDDLVRVEGEETPTVWVVSDSEENQVAYVYQGPMGHMGDYQVRDGMALTSEWVHVYTGRPDYYLRLMERPLKRVALDPAQEIHHVWTEERFRRALPMADAFFANRGELETAMAYMGVQSAEGLLEYVDLLLITLGSQGSLLVDRRGQQEVPAIPPERVVDPTGAGDAFRAGFYAGDYHGYGLRDSAVIGGSSASFAIEAKGGLSQVPGWEEVLARADPFLI